MKAVRRDVPGKILAYAAFAAVAAYAIWTAARMGIYASLTSVADDSSNYLVMALHYSPWLTESDAVRSVWPLQYFPPLFPLLLALSGAVHDLLVAHLLVLLLGAMCIGALYRLVRAEMELPRSASLALCAAFGLMPGFLLSLQGILSEALYLLLSILFLLCARMRGRASLFSAAAIAAAMLTRSVGFVLLLALLVHVAIAALAQRRPPTVDLHVIPVALALYAGARWALAVPGEGEYLRIWQALLDYGALDSVARVSSYLMAQMGSLVDSWCAFLLVYWTDDRSLAFLIALLLGGLCLAGVVRGLLRNLLSAWYVAGYLLLVLLWPYPGQMVRLLMPIVPFLCLLGVGLLNELCAAREHRRRVGSLIFALTLVSIIPPHAYLHGRMERAEELHLVPVQEWLRKPDYAEGIRELGVQNGMLVELQRLRAETPPDSEIAYYEPSYVALLANRRAVRLPYPLNPDSLLPTVDLVLVTAIHPRQSRAGIDGLSLDERVLDRMQALRCGANPLSGLPVSCLYRFRE